MTAASARHPGTPRRGPSLLTLARQTLREHAPLSASELVLCACSGGADSTALLHVLALLRKSLGHRLMAVGVDHGLRPQARDELDLAARTAAELDVPWRCEQLSVGAGANLQARAREARHGALQRVAREVGAHAIAVGHTADDRAETVLIRLLRGAGPRGLAVLGPRSPCPVPASSGLGVQLIRPLIAARRTDVLAHLERQGLPYAEDPSNADGRFLRVRVRRELIPLLEEMSPRIVEHLCALAMMLAAGTGAADPLADLGRAQRLALERAARLGRRRATVRVRGGRDIEWVLEPPGPPGPTPPARARRGER